MRYVMLRSQYGQVEDWTKWLNFIWASSIQATQYLYYQITVAVVEFYWMGKAAFIDNIQENV